MGEAGILHGGFSMGQRRLGYGRLRHGMWAIAKAQAALDLAASGRWSGRPSGRRWRTGRGAVDARRLRHRALRDRLMVLHIAYKMEKGQDLRQENSIAKNYIANMIHKVVDTSLQIHGSLGFTHDTPLAHWYQEVRAQRLVDGPDEVHRWKIGKTVLDTFRRTGSTALAAGGDLV
jgi:acyl-CoA dehydrogenase